MKVRTHCTRDCPDACGVIATVEDGRVTRIEGDPDHPVTRGFLCYRTNRFLERQYSSDRLTTPLVRDGAGFRPIGWDDALDRIAETMLRIRDESGGAAILQYKSGGSLGLSKHLTELFFERFGPVTVKSGDICSGAGEAAQEIDFGDCDSNDLFDLWNSRTILLWGKNLHVSSVHLIPVLHEARARGARLVQIDPIRHRAADLCDLWVRPRPGGDGALILAMLQLLFETGRIDPQAATYCDHLEDLRRTCYARSVSELAQIADVPVAQIEELTDLYADGPSANVVGWGMPRRAQGAATVRLLDALTAVSGNLGVAGGGVSFFFKRRGAFDVSFHAGLAGAARSIPEPLLGHGILAAADPPVRMVWVHNGNPVAALPDSATVVRALESRELTVVVDAFLTDTASCAHLVLPTTTMLEDDDLVGSYGHHWIGAVRPVVDPPGEVRTDYRIVQGLARRVGLGDAFSEDIRAWQQRMVAPLAADGVTLARLERESVRNPRAASVLFADHKFPTASGKVNLIRTFEPRPPCTTPERPLLLMALATRHAQASQWPAQRQTGLPPITVHPSAAPGAAAGSVVRVESEVGALEARLCFDPRQRPDLALMEKGGWFRAGRCANILIPAHTTDEGEGAVYYDTAVRIVPVEARSGVPRDAESRPA